MATLEISEKAKEMLDAMGEKFGVSPTDLFNTSIEMTDKIIKNKDYDLSSAQTLIALQVSFLGCATTMMKSSNATKMVFEAHPISITIEDMESEDMEIEDLESEEVKGKNVAESLI